MVDPGSEKGFEKGLFKPIGTCPTAYELNMMETA